MELARARSLALTSLQPLFRSNILPVSALTALVRCQIQRPTTTIPVDWVQESLLRISVVLRVDGIEYRATGHATGGIAAPLFGVEPAVY